MRAHWLTHAGAPGSSCAAAVSSLVHASVLIVRHIVSAMTGMHAPSDASAGGGAEGSSPGYLWAAELACGAVELDEVGADEGARDGVSGDDVGATSTNGASGDWLDEQARITQLHTATTNGRIFEETTARRVPPFEVSA